jgi:hypothetical protein
MWSAEQGMISRQYTKEELLLEGHGAHRQIEVGAEVEVEVHWPRSSIHVESLYCAACSHGRHCHAGPVSGVDISLCHIMAAMLRVSNAFCCGCCKWT